MVPDNWWGDAKARDYEILFGIKLSPVETNSEETTK